MKPFAVFDIDGTIFRSSLVIELVYKLVKTGAFPPEAREEFRAAHDAWQRREHTEAYDVYVKALVNSYTKHLTGKKREVIELVSKQVVTKYKAHTYTYTRDLIKNLRANDYVLFAISGSPSELVSAFCEEYGFDDFIAAKYVVDERGKYTGEVVTAHSGKEVLLDAMVKRAGLDYKGSKAIGDSRGDISLLEAVEQPVAFNPDKDLFAAAKENKWPVVIERKNVIYNLEMGKSGYTLS